MSIDLDAIKRKLNELSGNSNGPRKSNFWRPELGEYKVRLLPWQDNDGQPFKEKWFYYNIKERGGILAPVKLGLPDPVAEFCSKLWEEGTPASREMAKQLRPKMRAYAPVIVRGEDEEEVKIWSFGHGVYVQLLGYFVDSDYGDLTHPAEGFDLKVSFTKEKGRMYQTTNVTPRPRSSALHDDANTVKKLLESVPNLDEIYKPESYEVIKAHLDRWAMGASNVPSDTVGTEMSNSVSQAVAASSNDDAVVNKHEREIDKAFADLF
jgi:hypothetical protein